MELRTYYDFALDDYRFLCELKKNGITANSIGAIAQNTCERFLKHLIKKYLLQHNQLKLMLMNLLKKNFKTEQITSGNVRK